MAEFSKLVVTKIKGTYGTGESRQRRKNVRRPANVSRVQPHQSLDPATMAAKMANWKLPDGR